MLMEKKLREKRKQIITRLKDLNRLPEDLTNLTKEQEVIYNQIMAFDFTYWEEVKVEMGWVHTRKTANERALVEKKRDIRSYFRKRGVLPEYGEPLTEEQQKIIDDIEAGDFTFHEQYKNDLKAKRLINDVNTSIKKKKERIRGVFRKHNILPPVGVPMDEEQQKIYDQIENGDFTYYEDFIKQKKIDVSGEFNLGYTENSKPKMVLHRLRLVQVLPPVTQPLTEEQEAIVQDVYENWEGKTKNYFISKYLHLTTAEGRIYYRMYKANRDYGFNFNLEISDIVIPEYCPLLSIKLSTDPADKDKDNYYTPDRIDSSKGYVKGNLQIISLKANRMKHCATQEQLLKFAVNGLTLIKKMEEYGKTTS